MTTLKIVSDREDVTDIIRSAISSEIKRLEIGLNKTNDIIKKFEEKYNISSEIFLREFTAEDLSGGDEEYIIWAGELKIRDKILGDLKKLKDIEYVANWISIWSREGNWWNTKTGFLVSSELIVDIRTEKIGLIRATIIFSDDSKLFVTEYLDLRYKIEKLTYSFHYQDKVGNLIFRYDNAAHKPVTFNYHKHVNDAILESQTPELRNILEEIIRCLL